jgi:hypothetical protein
MVGTVAQALTREDEVERTSILNVIGETPLTAEQNTSLVTVMERRRLNPCQIINIALSAAACQSDFLHDSSGRAMQCLRYTTFD